MQAERRDSLACHQQSTATALLRKIESSLRHKCVVQMPSQL